MTTQIYGIKNCNSIKKTRDWFEANNQPYQFVDYKKTPPTETQLAQWLQKIEWTELINRRGTTWRKLDEHIRAELNAETAIPLMIDKPSLIKRPLITQGDRILLGFDEQQLKDFYNI